MKRAIFMDRDGVINKLPAMVPGESETWYVLKWEDWQWADGAIEGLKSLTQTDYRLLVVSNQSCVGRGLASYRDIESIFGKMSVALTHQGASVGFYFCPHAPKANCACRKPRPGLIYKAAVEHEIDLSKSWMIGDMHSDMRAGWNAGIRRLIRITEEYDPPPQMKFNSTRGHPQRSLMDAAKFIIALDGLHSAKTS